MQFLYSTHIQKAGMSKAGSCLQYGCIMGRSSLIIDNKQVVSLS